MKHRALISMLMLENVLRSYRRTCLQQPFTHRSSTVHHDGSRSQASCVLHAQARERLAFVAARRCSCARERFAWVTLKYAPFMLPCSRTPCAHRRSFLQQPCASLTLIVATSSLLLATALIGPHRRSSYQASCVHPLFIHAKAGELLAHA